MLQKESWQGIYVAAFHEKSAPVSQFFQARDQLVSCVTFRGVSDTNSMDCGSAAQEPGGGDDEDDEIGDDMLTPSGNSRKLYEKKEQRGNGRRNGNGVGGGSRLLRQSLGAGSSLGEKIGEDIETAAYKGVCAAVMAILARSLAALHGVNVMKLSDLVDYLWKVHRIYPLYPTLSFKDDYDAQRQ